MITKYSSFNKENGNTLHKVSSTKDQLYFQFEVDKNNRIGNWKNEKEIPFKEAFIYSEKASLSNNPEELATCSSLPFMQCMDCMIIKICGSDWVCAISCGIFLQSCVGAAAITCVLL